MERLRSMHRSWSLVQGWARHQHFGLRQEWLALYLRCPSDWRQVGGLGNRQVQSLEVWLRTVGLHDRPGHETALCQELRRQGLASPRPWQRLWTNAVLNWPTADWYVSECAYGEWTSSELKGRLLASVPRLAERTASNAIMELVGLLERTPIGKELKQGEVIRARLRLVRRIGLADPGPEAILYAAGALFARERRCRLELQEPLPWPWIVFGCRPEEALATLSAYGSGWFEVRPHSLELLGPMEGLPYAVVC